MQTDALSSMHIDIDKRFLAIGHADLWKYEFVDIVFHFLLLDLLLDALVSFCDLFLEKCNFLLQLRNDVRGDHFHLLLLKYYVLDRAA